MTPRSEGTSGTEPRPTIGIGHLTILRGEALSLLCWPGGDFDAVTDPSVGLYRRDTRYLSRLRLLCCGSEMIQLDSHERGVILNSTLTNPAMVDCAGQQVPGQSLVIRRERALRNGITERITLANYGHHATELQLDVEYACDFEDIFVIRGVRRKGQKPVPRTSLTADRAVFDYAGADGINRRTTMQFSPAPNTLTTECARFTTTLKPGQTFGLALRVSLDRRSAPSRVTRAAADAEADREMLLANWAAIESSSPQLNALFERAVSDIASLSTPRSGRRFLAAGVPWFDALFGRDSLIAGMALLGYQPEILRDALLLLADAQARRDDRENDAEPGKIPHELRVGELANLGEVPFGRYYGSVDATPLFIWAAQEYVRWTGDQETLSSLGPALGRALNWCETRRRSSPIGALTYERESPNGLEHQGWKDSEDAVPTPDGAPLRGPLALIEVQGYLAAALAAAAALPANADTVVGDEEVHALLGTIARNFFVDGEPVLAIDGSGEAIRAQGSNPGHLLWAGACSAAHARKISELLSRADLFSGWGVRTLSSADAAFNPLGYHTGSVWPHDNAIILAGLRRYGFVERVRSLGSALLEAMLGFADQRIPELFSGDARGDRVYPTPYPVASRPQAWSAASLPWVLQTLAGVIAENEHTLHVVRPVLPDWLDWLRLKNVRFGQSTLNLMFRRVNDHVGVEVERQRGPGSVVLSPRWPVPPLR